MGLKNKNCFKRSVSILVLLFLFIVVLIGATIFASLKFGVKKASANPGTCYWVGVDNPDNWNDAANWSSSSGVGGGSCEGGANIPQAGTAVVFDGANNNSVNVDIDVSVASITAAANTYTGTFDATTHSVNLSGDLTFSKGTLSMGSNTWTVAGNVTFTGITALNANSSTLALNGAAQQNLTSASKSLNNLLVQNTHANGVRPVGTLTVLGNLTIQADGASAVTLDNANNVAINVTGNLATAGAGAGAKNIKMGTGTWTVSGNVTFTGGTITASTSTLTMKGAGTTTFTTNAQTLYNFNPSNTTSSAQTVIISGNLTINGGISVTTTGSGGETLDCTSNPTVAVGNISYSKTSTGVPTILMGNGTWTVSANVDFTNGTVTAGLSTLTMTGTTTFVGNGQILYNFKISGTIKAITSDVSVSNNLTVDTAKTLTIDTTRTLTMLTGATTTLTGTGTITGASGTLALNDSAGALLGTGGTLSSLVKFDATAGDVTIPQRTYGSGVTFYTNSSAAARTVTLGTAGSQTLNFSSNFTVSAANTQDILVTGTVNSPIVNITRDITFSKSSSGTPSITMGSSAWTVTGNVSLENGAVTSTSGILSVAGDWNDRGGTFTHNSGTLTFNNTADKIFESSGSQTYNNIIHSGAGKLTMAGTFPAALTGWSYRRAIYIDHKKFPDVATPSITYADFPALISLSGLSNINVGGSDIRFTTSDGQTFLPREIESYASDTLIAWVKFTPTKDAGDSTDDFIYMYYGNAGVGEPAANSPYGSQNVWANYNGVWHMGEASWTVGSASALDSTANGKNMTVTGAGCNTYASSLIGRGGDFDANGRYISNANVSPASGAFSLEAWMWWDNSNSLTYRNVFNSGGYGIPGVSVSLDNKATIANILLISMSNITQLYNNHFAPGWQHVALTYDGNGGKTVNFYMNGIFISTISSSNIWSTLFQIAGSGFFKGDEARVSNANRSANWLVTEYNNQYSPATFATKNGESDNAVITANIAGNLTNSGGTMDLGASTVGVGGNIDSTGGTLTAGTSTVTMNGSAQQNLTSASQSFNNLVIKNTHANGVRPVGTLTVTGNLTVQADGASAVTLDNANNVAINVTGNLTTAGAGGGAKNIKMGTNTWTISGDVDFTGGSITGSASTLKMNGAGSKTFTTNNQPISNFNLSNATSSAQTVIVSGNLTLSGNLSVTTTDSGGQTLDCATNNPTVAIAGNISYSKSTTGIPSISMGNGAWSVSGNIDFTGGTATAGNSTLTLNGSSAGQTIILVSQPFNNLIVTNNHASGVTFADNATVSGTFTDTTASSKLTFHAGSTYAFANASINGLADGTRITMLSSSPGTPWLFNVSNSETVSWVSVTDSNAAGGLEISDSIRSNHDGGGNTHWVFNLPSNPTTVAATVNGNPVSTGTWTNQSGVVSFTFSGALNGGVGGILGYYAYFGNNASADPVTAGAYQAHVGAIGDDQIFNSSISTPDDCYTLYFIVKTKNTADNISAAGTLFNLGYDITLPLRPSFAAADPAGYTTVNSFTFSWPAGSDPNGPGGGASGVKWYEYKRATDGIWSHTANAGERTVAGLTAYQEGANVFYVRTIDNAGNTSADYQQVTYYWSGTAPAKPTDLEVTPGTSDTNSFTIHWHKPAVAPGDPPIVGYYYSINVYPTNLNTTYVGSEANTVTIGPDAYASQQGANTVYILSVNAAGSRSFEPAYVASTTFNCQTAAPPIPTSVSLYDSSDRALSRWMLTLQWVAGAGQDPATFDHYIIYRSTDGIGFVQLATTTSTAYIDASGLNNTTTYYYNIKAVDNAGQESAQSATVQKMPTGNYITPPTLLSNPSVSEIKATSAKITWITDRASSSIVRYGTQIGTFSASSGQFDSVTNHSVTLLGLNPGAVYYYQTQSLDESRDYPAEDAYSTTFSFVTLPAPAISNVQISNITLTNADISWETTTVAHSVLNYGQTNAYGSSLDDQSGSGTTSHNVKLQSLTPGTSYHFKISGTDADGNVLVSDDYQFETLPLPMIENLKIEPISGKPQSAFRATWTTNVPTTTIIKYRLSTEAENKEQVKTKSEISHEVVVEGLLDNSIYLITAEGRDALGNLAQSSVQSFKTPLDTRPPVITDVIIETSNVGLGQKDTAQMAVSWKTDEVATSQVEYADGLSGDQYTQKTVEDGTLTKSHLVIISELTPSKPYHLRVVSKDKAGNVANSSDNTVISGEVPMSILQLILKILRYIFGWMGI